MYKSLHKSSKRGNPHADSGASTANLVSGWDASTLGSLGPGMWIWISPVKYM